MTQLTEATSAHVFYFGCWGRAGHGLHVSGGRSAFQALGGDRTACQSIEYYGRGDNRHHLDGTLAPRRDNYTGKLCWSGQDGKERRLPYRSEECPQGQFLIHHLDNGFTAMQWWDRNQGDSRSGCNSTILLKGEHTAEGTLAALREYFPEVAANLKQAGVDLVDATLLQEQRDG